MTWGDIQCPRCPEFKHPSEKKRHFILQRPWDLLTLGAPLLADTELVWLEHSSEGPLEARTALDLNATLTVSKESMDCLWGQMSSSLSCLPDWGRVPQM